jgi:hypothetical protein
VVNPAPRNIRCVQKQREFTFNLLILVSFTTFALFAPLRCGLLSPYIIIIWRTIWPGTAG